MPCLMRRQLLSNKARSLFQGGALMSLYATLLSLLAVSMAILSWKKKLQRLTHEVKSKR